MASLKERMAKACEEMKRLYGTPEAKVKSALKHLLRRHGKAWDIIEENYYKVLLECTEENKVRADDKKIKSNVVENLSDVESKEPEPTLKRCRRNHKEQNFISVDNSSLQLAKRPSVCLQLDEPVLEIKEPARPSPCKKAKTLHRTNGDIHNGGGPAALVASTVNGRALDVDNGTGIVSKSNMFGLEHNSYQEPPQKYALQYKPPLADIHPGPPGLLHEESSRIQNCVKVETFGSKSLESKLVDTKDKVAGFSYLSKLDIVSSDNGDMKISLIYNSSIKCNTRMPSMDAVLEVVEAKFRKRYGITDPEFSVEKLMREFCKCFLAMRTDEAHVQPMSMSKKSVSKVLTNGKHNHQSNSKKHPIHSPGSVESQDTADKEPQVSEPANSDGSNGIAVGKASAENEKKNGIRNHDPRSSNSCSMENDQKHYPPLTITNNSIFVEDITRGEERQPISMVSVNGSLELPKFFYISKNTVYKNAYVNFSLARISDHNCCSNCSGNCLSAPANCACTGETRGDFAYTAGGLVEEKFLDECIGMSRRKTKKENFYYCKNCPLENTMVKSSKQQKRKRSKKPCKGHLMRKFIKECWAKCGCNRNCGNRVVQRGITVKLQVFQTPQGKGWGVRTIEKLEKGTFVCEYVGEIVTNQELHERNEGSTGEEHTYPVLLDADWASERHLKDEEALCLDATKFGNVARFINHRCYDANLVEIPVEVETPDHHYYHIAFFTSRKIDVNEELTWDYGIDFDDETHPIKAFECKCGSSFCGMKNRSSC